MIQDLTVFKNPYRTKLLLALYDNNAHCIILQNHNNYYYIIISKDGIEEHKNNDVEQAYKFLKNKFIFFNLCVTNKDLKVNNEYSTNYFNINFKNNVFYKDLKFQPANNEYFNDILYEIYKNKV